MQENTTTQLHDAPQIIEAILFVAGEPVRIGDLAVALDISEMETIHAVEELERKGFRAAIMDAMGACAEKSRQMSK